MFHNLVAILIAVLVVIYTYFKWSFNYWARKKVTYIEPTFPRGNLSNPLYSKRSFTMDVFEIYKQLKSKGVQYGGFFMFTGPVYIPIDPEHLKSVLIKDFSHFVNRGIFFNEEIDPLSANLFAIEDEKWRNLRTKITPTFTSGKMKTMFPTLVDCSIPLQNEVANLSAQGEDLDVKELIARFTTDVIGSCAFGIDCNSFKNPDAEFRKYGKKSFEQSVSLKFIFLLNFPNICKRLGVRNFNKEVTDFFSRSIRDTIKYREENNYRRNDFLQMLIDLKNKDNEDKHDGTTLTINEIAAQAFIFFLAGFETSSTTLTYCLYELSKHPEVQEKVREEIERILAKYNGELCYDAIQDMKYVDQTLNETLRMYPPVPVLNRVCTQDYIIPDTDILLQKGSKLAISVYGIHHDPEYYPEPSKFDPDRFSEENKASSPPCTFLPFGDGPRICIGLRFGMMQAKVGLIAILRNYKLTLSPKTPVPVRFDPKSFILINKDTIYLQSKRIK